MTKKKKKPSKRGKKANKNDCNTGEEDKKFGKMD